jgi:hypothetical protein
MELELIGYFVSIFMGLSLGLLGGGGAILTVPILVYLFKINPVLATAYSLFIVGLTALFGGLNYYKKGEVDLKTGIIFAIPSITGVYLTRSLVIPNIPMNIVTIGNIVITKPLLIMAVFSVIMLLASFSMIRPRKENIRPLDKVRPRKNYIIPLQGFMVGSIAGFVGAGGGFLIIPTLVVLVGLPMKRAIGTSLFIIAAQSLLGFIGDVQHQVSIEWSLLFKIASMALIGLFLGIKLSDKVSEKGLKKGFGFFVLAMGTFIFIDQLRKLH